MIDYILGYVVGIILASIISIIILYPLNSNRIRKKVKIISLKRWSIKPPKQIIDRETIINEIKQLQSAILFNNPIEYKNFKWCEDNQILVRKLSGEKFFGTKEMETVSLKQEIIYRTSNKMVLKISSKTHKPMYKVIWREINES